LINEFGLTQRRKEKIIFMLKENKIAKLVVDAAYHVHINLGPGLLESVYEKVLAYELEKRELSIKRQHQIPIQYDDLVFDEGFKADIMVEDSVILELKSVESVAPVHKKQLLTYLRLADKRLGLLINFGAPLIKKGIFRIVNRLEE
jgi:GxxExxY protein